MDGHIDCCGACAHAAAVSLAGGPEPNPNGLLHFDLGPDGVPRGATLVFWQEWGGRTFEATVFPVNKSYLVLGGKPPADVVIDMVVLSRRQCGFDFSIGQAVVEDLQSACGTYVNGEQVTRQALRAGDRVTMGDLILEVRPVL